MEPIDPGLALLRQQMRDTRGLPTEVTETHTTRIFGWVTVQTLNREKFGCFLTEEKIGDGRMLYARVENSEGTLIGELWLPQSQIARIKKTTEESARKASDKIKSTGVYHAEPSDDVRD